MPEFIVFEGFGNGCSLKISDDQYATVQVCRTTISCAQEIEESFGVAARSYIDLENAMMSAAFEWSLEDIDYESHNGFFNEWREVLNLKLLSFVIAGNAYAEKMEKIARRKVIPDFNWTVYDPHRRGVFDTNFSYRLMCALRNYSAHNQLPLGGVSVGLKNEFPSGKYSQDQPVRTRYTCNPHIVSKPLELDKDFKKVTREEIKALDVLGFDLKMTARGYMEGLYSLHAFVRELTEKPVVEALEYLADLEEQLSRHAGTKAKHVYVAEKGKGLEDSYYIYSDKLSKILGRRKNWMKLKGLRHRYISSEVISKKSIYLGDVDHIWVES